MPETRTPGDVLLFVIFAPFEPFARAETVPASSSVAPLETVAVTPVSIVAVPDATLNRSVPAVICSDVLLLNVEAPSISSTPVPVLAIARVAPLSLTDLRNKMPVPVPLFATLKTAFPESVVAPNARLKFVLVGFPAPATTFSVWLPMLNVPIVSEVTVEPRSIVELAVMETLFDKVTIG